MNIEVYRNFCLSLKGVTESFPFGEETLVFKVKGKMFTATDVDFFQSINVKCDPEKIIELRERYNAVKPGYHMNKNHWNTIEMDHSISDEQILEWVKDSYEQVVSKLPKKERAELEQA